jgi:hypothetical protein
MAADMPATRLVYVADPKADLVAMIMRAQALGTPVDWLVRPKHNCCLPDGDGEKLLARTTAREALGEIAFTMPAREGKKSRKVRQQLLAHALEISNGKGGRWPSPASWRARSGRPRPPGRWSGAC